jgi:chaperonin GroES
MALTLNPSATASLWNRPKRRKSKKGGIIIPDSAKEKPTEGIVIALGTGKTMTTARKFRLKSKRATAFCQQIRRHGNQDRRQGIQDPVNSDDILAVIE